MNLLGGFCQADSTAGCFINNILSFTAIYQQNTTTDDFDLAAVFSVRADVPVAFPVESYGTNFFFTSYGADA